MPGPFTHTPVIYNDTVDHSNVLNKEPLRSALVTIMIGNTTLAYLQNVTLTAQRQLQRLIELGTEELYFVPFRVFGVMEAQKAMGPSKFFANVGRYFTPFITITGFKSPIKLYYGRLTQAQVTVQSSSAVMMENVVIMGDLQDPTVA